MPRLACHILLILLFLLTLAGCDESKPARRPGSRPMTTQTATGDGRPHERYQFTRPAVELKSYEFLSNETGQEEYYDPHYRPRITGLGKMKPEAPGSITAPDREEGYRDYRDHLPGPYPSLNPTVISDEILLQLGFDNDIWDGTDYYYTNGISVGLYHPGIRYSPISRALLPDMRKAVNHYGLVLVQDIYTPMDPDEAEIQLGDRPFASCLYVGHRKISLDPAGGYRITSGLDLGIMGEAAMGGAVQATIHDIEPRGWENQIVNDFIINYLVSADKSIFRAPWMETSASAKLEAGTLHNRLSMGLSFRMGRFNSLFSSLSQTTSRKESFRTRIRYYFTMGGEARFVAYDATFQGGIINHRSVYTLPAGQVERLVYRAFAGIGLGAGRFSLEAEQVLLSPEFKGGRRHLWLGLRTMISL